MLIPLRTDSPLRTTPWMNWALIATNVITFLAQMKYSAAMSQWMLNPMRPELEHFVSYAFLHAGWGHIISNMLFLYIFGNNVNDRMGNIGYLGFYLAGAIFAGSGYVLFTQGPHPVLGASGAVAAVTGAYLVLFPRSNITVVYWWFFIGMAEISSLWFIGLFFVLDLAGEFVPILGGQQSVAHMAHISGSLFGFVLCLALLWMHLLPRDPFDIVAMIQRWNRRRQYRSVVRSGYDPFAYDHSIAADAAGPAATPPPLPDPNIERIQILRDKVSEAIADRDLPTAARLYLEINDLDPQRVLPRAIQIDVANQLAHEGLYPQAATAYEQLLRAYPNYEQIEQVQLMLGLIYSRYLERPDLARDLLRSAISRLHTPRELDLAREELARIEPAP